jgi:hypothetical protein
MDFERLMSKARDRTTKNLLSQGLRDWGNFKDEGGNLSYFIFLINSSSLIPRLSNENANTTLLGRRMLSKIVFAN